MPKKKKGDLLNNFRIFETNEFIKKISTFPVRDSTFLQSKLSEYVYPQLREEPFWGKNIKKLRGYRPVVWRYRIGKYRLFYSVDAIEKVVYILTRDLRKNVYK